MHYPFSLRTRLWPCDSQARFSHRAASDRLSPHAVPSRPARTASPGDSLGAASIVTLLLSLALGCLAMGMLCLSQAHLKAAAANRLSLFLDYAAENGIKSVLRDALSRLDAGGRRAVISETEEAALRAVVTPGNSALAEAVLGTALPLDREEAWDDWRWRGSVEGPLESLEDHVDYIVGRHRLLVRGEGRIRGFRPIRRSVFEAELAVALGRLPLTLIPLHIAAVEAGGGADEFLRVNGISLPRPRETLIPPQPLLGDEPLIPENALPLVEEALRVRIFRPQDLTPARLRAALGLDPSEEPVPAGVYLVHDDLGLGGVFIQGDLDELVAAVDGDWQVLAFRMEAGEWVLRYSPGRCRTEFAGPEGTRTWDLLPWGVLVADGKIASFGGGTVTASGEVVMAGDEDVPALLRGVSLTVITSDTVTLSTHLVLQGVQVRDGVPYLRDSQSQLVIFATGQTAAGGENRDAGIIIDADSPQQLKIQASLAAGGSGLTIEGRGKTVEVLGSLAATGYTGNGNALTLHADPRAGRGITPAGLSPSTASPLLAVTLLEAVAWRHNAEDLS